MLERLQPILRIVCLLLAGLVLYQLSRIAAHKDPFENLGLADLVSALNAGDAPAAHPGTNTARGTNAVPSIESGVANPGTNMARPTNAVSRIEPAVGNPGTNTVRANNAVSGRAVAKTQTDLPPAVQARVDRITQSEILGAIIRPLPMALIGIAGKDVFLRSANGQTGLLREGEELGGVKLLRIGINRVLVEHEQQQKELTVFAGDGGESLLPKGEKNIQ